MVVVDGKDPEAPPVATFTGLDLLHSPAEFTKEAVAK